MKFSIIIPTFNNCDYLKLCINSIEKNSSFKHELIIHINGSDSLTEEFLILKKYKYTKTTRNVGLCSGVNIASGVSTTDYLVYAHDDMYFLPKWDEYLTNDINKLNNNLYYLSCTQISHYTQDKGLPNHITYDVGKTIDDFDEEKLLKNFDKLVFHDLQGSHWAPHIIHKELWNKVGGFSEEFDPGFGSDPDLNMKLWQHGVRIFKGVNKSRVYHFGSLTTRKKINLKRNNGRRTFLLKWKISIDFFVKNYLKRGQIYKSELDEPKFNFFILVALIQCKIKYFLQLLNKKLF